MVTQTRTQVTIRPFLARDYPGYVAVSDAAYPDYPMSVEALRYDDEHHDPKCRQERFVAEADGAIIGIGGYDQWPAMYHPWKFAVDVTVAPEWQGRGVGSALYTRVLAALEPFAPLAIRSQVREDSERGVRLIQDRGFVAGMRSWESRLAVADFDLAPFTETAARVAARGITIRTIPELAGDPARDRKLHALELDLIGDVPAPEPRTPISLARFVARLSDPGFIPEAYFIALDDATGEYVGMSQLWRGGAGDDLTNGLTGVRRAYRRRGIALALKLRGIAYAQAVGAPTIKTWNETHNAGMLAINEALGFVRQPAWVDFIKTLREEPHTAD